MKFIYDPAKNLVRPVNLIGTKDPWQMVAVPPVTCGIYALLDADGFPVYIGKSIHVHRRLMEHRKDGMPFDSAAWFLCPQKDLNKKERRIIKQLRPALNRFGK